MLLARNEKAAGPGGELLDEDIQQYSQLTAQLETDSSKLLTTLLLRNKLDAGLHSADLPTAERADVILRADKALSEFLRDLSRKDMLDALGEWQRSFRTADAQWWWVASPKISWLAKSVQGALWVLTAISLAYLLEIIKRLLGTAPDTLSVTLQGVLGLLAVGTVFQASRQWLSAATTASPTSLRRHGLPIVSIATALIFLLSQNWLARYIVQNGTDAFLHGDVRTAIAQYERAIRLDSNLAIAHYGLASADAAILDYDAAETEYRLAAMSGGGSNDLVQPFACSQLAALLIKREAKFDVARIVAAFGLERQRTVSEDPARKSAQVEIMRGLLNLSSNPAVPNPQIQPIRGESEDAGLQYCLHRDLSRANLELKQYIVAYDEAGAAQQVREAAPAGHYLRAVAGRALRKSKGEVEAEFETFLSYSNKADEIETDWATTAAEVLFPKTKADKDKK